jgi:septation ring formation regulator EzrA
LSSNQEINKKLDQLLSLFQNYSERQRLIELEIQGLKTDTISKFENLKRDVDSLKESEAVNRIEEEAEKINEQVDKSRNSLTDAEQGIYDDMQELERTSGEITLRALGERNQNLDYKTISGYANRLIKYGLIRKERDSANRINKYVLARIRSKV